MKHPFWIVNVGLLSFVLCSCVFIYFSRTKITPRESIEPTSIGPRKELKVAVNIQKIYENDLFGTYIKELPRPQNLSLIAPFPAPPVLQKIAAPKIIEPTFLDPLQVTLMGIIVVGSNDTKNRAILQEDKTKQENTYKVGDVIQDAQLIRIFKNKVILLRLNGQQEVLYLREQDAKNDISYAPANEWDNVIKKISNTEFFISPEHFTQKVESLTQFIDMINSTTAYQKGKSIGLKIGQISPESLATTLGLQKGDIITSINNIPAETTEERLAIYKNITTLPLGNTIKVKLTRKNREMLFSYTLNDFTNEQENSAPTKTENESTAFLHRKNTSQSIQEHYAFTPTLNKLKKTDRQMMLENGKILPFIGS